MQHIVARIRNMPCKKRKIGIAEHYADLLREKIKLKGDGGKGKNQ